MTKILPEVEISLEPIRRLTRDEARAATALNVNEIRYLVNAYYDSCNPLAGLFFCDSGLGQRPLGNLARCNPLAGLFFCDSRASKS